MAELAGAAAGVRRRAPRRRDGHARLRPLPDATRERITISFYARLLDGLLDELAIDAAAIVGNSMGGFISAELAIAFPQRVERLVLVSAAGMSTYGDPREALAAQYCAGSNRRSRRSPRGERSMQTRSPAGRRCASAILGDCVSHPGRLPAPMAAELVRGAGKPGFMQAIAANFDYDFRDRLPEIACPTLIVWGEHDRLVTVRDAPSTPS